MEVNTTPNTARGEVKITIGGQPQVVKFNLRTLYAWTKLTGKAPSDLGVEIDINHLEALSGLLACGVRQLPGHTAFSQEDAIDLIEGFSPEEAEQVATAVVEAVMPDPLVAALRKQVAAKTAPQVLPENGADTSASA